MPVMPEDDLSAQERREYGLRWNKAHHAQIRVNEARDRRKLLDATRARYGSECARCGSSAKRLCLARQDGQSVAEVTGIPGEDAWATRRWLRDRGWPDGFVMVCPRCL